MGDILHLIAVLNFHQNLNIKKNTTDSYHYIQDKKKKTNNLPTLHWLKTLSSVKMLTDTLYILKCTSLF